MWVSVGNQPPLEKPVAVQDSETLEGRFELWVGTRPAAWDSLGIIDCKEGKCVRTTPGPLGTPHELEYLAVEGPYVRFFVRVDTPANDKCPCTMVEVMARTVSWGYDGFHAQWETDPQGIPARRGGPGFARLIKQ